MVPGPRTRAWVDQHLWLLFGVSAVRLVPWIVILYLTPRSHDVALHMTPLRVTLLAMIALLTLVSAIRTTVRPAYAPLSAAAAATYAITAAWFALVTANERTHLAFLVTTACVLIAAAVANLVLLAGSLTGWSRMQYAGQALAVGALVLLVYGAFEASSRDVRRLRIDHVDLVWVGLDIAECVALAALALSLHGRKRVVVVAGPVTASLLISDALINVLTARTPDDVASAALMAVVELGLAGAAVYAAYRTRIRWVRQARMAFAARSANRVRSSV